MHFQIIVHVCICPRVYVYLRTVLGYCKVVIAQWSERRQQRSEALGLIPSGCPGIFSFLLLYDQFLPPVVNQYIYCTCCSPFKWSAFNKHCLPQALLLSACPHCGTINVAVPGHDYCLASTFQEEEEQPVQDYCVARWWRWMWVCTVYHSYDCAQGLVRSTVCTERLLCCTP